MRRFAVCPVLIPLFAILALPRVESATLALCSWTTSRSHIRFIHQYASLLADQFNHTVYLVTPPGVEKKLLPSPLIKLAPITKYREMDQLSEGDTLESLKGKNALTFMMSSLEKLLDDYMETLEDVEERLREIKPDLVLQMGLGLYCSDASARLNIPVVSHAPILTSFLQRDPVPWVLGMIEQQSTGEVTVRNLSLLQRVRSKIRTLSAMIGVMPSLVRYWWYRKSNGLQGFGMGGPNVVAVIVNSFMPLHLPVPTRADELVVGPIVDMTPKDPEPEVQGFLDAHKRIGYLAFGQMARGDMRTVKDIKDTIEAAIESGLLDGFIWVNPHQDFSTLNFDNDSVLVLRWTSQLYILSHPHTVIFISHCGGDSVMESSVAGVKVMGVPFFGDQAPNCAALKSAGLGDFVPYTQWDGHLFRERFLGLLTDESMTKMVSQSSALARRLAQVAPMNAALFVQKLLVYGPRSLHQESDDMSALKRSGWDLALLITGVLVAAITVALLTRRRKRGLTPLKKKAA